MGRPWRTVPGQPSVMGDRRRAGVTVGMKSEVGWVAAQDQCVRKNRRRRIDGGESNERVTPPVPFDQQRRERHEHDRREPADERQHRERAASLLTKPCRDDGEGRLVEHGGCRDPDECPDHVERGEGVYARPRHEQRRREHRPHRHDAARPATIDPAAERNCRTPGDELRERECAGDLCLRPAELRAHWRDEDGERVGQHAVRDGRGDAEGRHHRPAIVQAWRPPSRPSRVRHRRLTRHRGLRHGTATGSRFAVSRRVRTGTSTVEQQAPAPRSV